jgi:hypothetical protein
MLRSLTLLAVLSMYLVASVSAQTEVEKSLTEDPARPQFRFVSTTKTSTFEKELNAAAKEGHRFVRLAKAFTDDGVAALVVREPANKDAPAVLYEYKVLATNKLSTLEKEFDEAAAQGYEFRGITSHAKGLPFTFPETIMVMERVAGETKRRFEYRFQSTQREKTTQKELDANISEGFLPIEMILSLDSNTFSVLFGSGTNVHVIIILSRSLENPAAEMGTREYRFLRTTKVSTMEKEMNQLAKEGFEFHLSSIGSITLMARPLKAKTQRSEYKLLATRKSGTMQKELLESGRQGYTYLATSSGAGGVVSVMEREVNGEGNNRRYEYKFLGTTLEDTTQKELNEALAAGYEFLELTTRGEKLIVLGRVAEGEPKPQEQK